MRVHIGIDEKDRRETAEGLSTLLADTYTLYLKTHNFHWNVTGPLFETLHLMFERQYQQLAEAVDQIAERIRALGYPAPASYADFIELTEIKEAKGTPPAMEMVKQLLDGHEIVIRTARSIFEPVQRTGDEASADLLIQRMRTHEKTAWMLRSVLEG